MYRREWIEYSVLDAKLTWKLYQVLKGKLEECPWSSNGSLFDFYQNYYVPFCVLLSDMERTGVHLNVDFLREIQEVAEQHSVKLQDSFIEWASSKVPDARFMNPRRFVSILCLTNDVVTHKSNSFYLLLASLA